MVNISDDVHVEDTRVSYLSRLQERKERLTETRQSAQGNYFGFIGGCIILFVTALSLLFIFKEGVNLLNFLLIFCVVFFAVLFSLLLIARAAITELDRKLETIEFEIDLLQFDVSSRETQAEKVLRINEIQLRRYYSLNLNQNIVVFVLGIICISFGVLSIVITMYIVVVVQSNTGTKIITAVIGSIGSLLSGYVAAIYLKMHASAASHLGSFHSRLVETHQLLLGNLLASRIEDDQKRWETLSQLALNMAKMSQ